jgi:hypothetical protein
MKHYVYKITFEEVPHFYFGVRSHHNPNLDSYLGTPITHRNYWKIYSPKKQILSVFSSREEAEQVEVSLISQNWNCRYCLNKNISGYPSIEARSKGGRNSHKVKTQDGKSAHGVRTSGITNSLLSKERKQSNGRKGALVKQSLYSREAITEQLKKARESRSMECKIRAGRKAGLKQSREVKRQNASKQHRQRWKCTVSGYISSPCGLSSYQRARGIPTTCREKLAQ